MSKVKIKRFDKSLPLPEYKTDGASCFDLHARETVAIEPGVVGYVPLNVAFETPAGHFFLLGARSSTHKLGVMPVNGIGIGDADFSGNEDEWKMALLNFTQKPVIIEKGTRIGQGMFVPTTKIEWQEVDVLENNTRGGFGSTGNN